MLGGGGSYQVEARVVVALFLELEEQLEANPRECSLADGLQLSQPPRLPVRRPPAARHRPAIVLPPPTPRRWFSALRRDVASDAAAAAELTRIQPSRWITLESATTTRLYCSSVPLPPPAHPAQC